MKIREATLSDMTMMFAISVGEEGHLEIPSYNYLTLNSHKMFETVSFWISHSSGMVYVAEKENKVIAYIIGEIFTPWCSDDLQNIIHILYVSKKYRNSNVGIKLFDYFLQETLKNKVQRTLMCMMYTSDNLQGMDKFLHKRGFIETAKYYQKEIQ